MRLEVRRQQHTRLEIVKRLDRTDELRPVTSTLYSVVQLDPPGRATEVTVIGWTNLAALKVGLQGALAQLEALEGV